MNRLGLIVAAAVDQNADPLLGERDASLLSDRLRMDDLGFEVVVLDPSIDLAEQIDELLQARSTSPEVLLYASCLLAVVDDDDCFLCLDPDEPDVGDALRDVASVLAEGAVRSLMVVEGRYDDPAADGSDMREVIDAVNGCVAGQVELIAAVRPAGAHPERVPSRLTVGVLEAIDSKAGRLTAKQAYAAAIQHADMGSWPHAVTYVPGRESFLLRQPAQEPEPVDAAAAPTRREGSQPPVEPSPTTEPSAAHEPAPEPEPVAAEPRQAPPPARRSQPRREAPPSERKQAATVTMSMRRRPQSAPGDLPKVVIGASPASAPEPSAPEPSAPQPSAPQAEPANKKRKRRASKEMLQTSPSGPGAIRQAAVEAKAKSEPPATGEDDPLDGLDEVSVEIQEPEPPSPPPKVEAAKKKPKKKSADMTVDDHVAAGDALRSDDELGAAVKEYKKALGKLGTAATPQRADVYLRIAGVSRQLGKLRIAISNYDKALSIAPTDARILQALIELNAGEENWRAVHSVEDRFFAGELEPDVRLSAMLESGARWLDAASDVKRARERFIQAREEFPDRVEPLRALLRIYEEEKNIDLAIDLRRRIAALTSNAHERAQQLFELGEYCLFEAGREQDGLDAFELVIDADPSMLEALEVLATQLADGQEWGELERIYHKMLDKFGARDRDAANVTIMAELHRRLALLYRDHLDDPESALKELDAELALRPDQLSAQLLSAEVAIELGRPERAQVYLRYAAKLDPRRSETFHQLFQAARRADDVEGAFLAASVSTQIGTANEREQIVFRENKPQGVPALHRPLRHEAWRWLRDAGRDTSVELVMRAIAPAVLRHRVAQLDEAGALPKLPEAGPQDPSESTVSAVRSVSWAAQFLDVAVPDIYVGEEFVGGLTAPFAHRQTTLIGREVLSGRTMVELAFLSGRHLALRLPEHELVAHLQSIEELSACFLAAVKIILGEAPASGQLGKAVATLAKVLARQQTPEEREALEDAVKRFTASGGRVDLKKWVASVEICATRAGFVLCGDLDVAVRVIGGEQDAHFVGLEERILDLYAFAVSDAHVKLRQELGCGLGDHDELPALD